MRGCIAAVLVAACHGGSPHGTPDGTNGDAIPPGCGDNMRSGTEQCDGTDLGGATCATSTSPGWIGVVACTASCQLNVAGCNPPPTTWSDITDSTTWSTFDVGALYPSAKGFASTVFDGRYVYFVPNNNAAVDGVVTRLDTQGGFGASASWETFDVATINAAAKGFIGGAFDGRYVYLTPHSNGAADGVIARYDTQASGGFGASSSWTTFDITTANANAKGLVNAAFDGRYLYFAPNNNGAADGLAVRYDTQSDFATATSWSFFDIATVTAAAKGYLGVVFDGRYLYFAPYNNAAYHGNVARFDTKATGGFTAAASWSTFNVATVNAHAVGFYGIAFDGRYVYLVQHYDGSLATPNYGGYIARYDTQAAFDVAASWSTFNAAGVNASAKGFVGATFDGRFIYMVPFYDGTAYDGVTVRYDTQGAGFTTAGSWSTFDVSTLNANAKGYHGAAFDGQYIYLAPLNNAASTPHGIVARFNAKTPSWLPLDWNAAFD